MQLSSVRLCMPVLGRLAVSVTLVAGGMIAVAPRASAAPAWSVVASPNPFGPPRGFLGGVSCSSASSCFAVGETGGSETLVERWNGTTWSTMTTPSPAGASFAGLDDVSCPTATSCYAVGRYATGFDFQFKTLVEHWNGTSWSTVASPNPTDGSTATSLSGVSCPSATNCSAVGSKTSSSATKTFVEQWNGTHWSIVASPNPTDGSTVAALSGVSCASATNCSAVGSKTSSSATKTFVEHWNGTSWSIVSSPNRSGSTAAVLSGVSCPSATSCYAVGASSIGSGDVTLMEQWNGTIWSIVPSPNRSGATASDLNDVSCSSSTSCFAVGGDSISTGDETLVEQWDGTSWSIVASPNATGSGTELVGVTCRTAASCSAVGFDGDFTLVEQWNGTSWSVAAAPSGSSQSQLAQVACPSTTSCFAVGDFRSSSATKSLVKQWNGTTWSIIASPNPAGASNSLLTGVSCSSPTSCFAVGWYRTSSGTKTLAERWNGASWLLVAIPNPGGAVNSTLNGVSCPTAIECTAVGSSDDGQTSSATLVEHWNGTSWSIVTSPNPSGATFSALSGVSCPVATSCYAVGFGSGGSPLAVTTTLVEHWDGATWSVVTSPNPAGTTSSGLSGVSCPSATSCNAVGEYMNGSIGSTLAEHWNGTTWAIVPSADVSGAFESNLTAVSCAGASNCFAVAFSSTNAGDRTLIEHWNGTSWSIVTSPNPAGATDSLLAGVSCPSGTSCFAVGRWRAPVSTYTLIERYA